MLRPKRTIVNKSRCLHAWLPIIEFKAVRPQLAVNILHNHMWTMGIFIVKKKVTSYSKIPQKLLFMPPRVEGVF